MLWLSYILQIAPVPSLVHDGPPTKPQDRARSPERKRLAYLNWLYRDGRVCREPRLRASGTDLCTWGASRLAELQASTESGCAKGAQEGLQAAYTLNEAFPPGSTLAVERAKRLAVFIQESTCPFKHSPSGAWARQALDIARHSAHWADGIMGLVSAAANFACTSFATAAEHAVSSCLGMTVTWRSISAHPSASSVAHPYA